MSSVPLQVFLTCNAYFSFTMFIVVMWVSYSYKVLDNLWEVDATWYGSLNVLWTCMEPARIYLGYRGNLRSSVSALCGFLMLTIIGHVSLMIVFSVLLPRSGSVDYAINTAQLCLASLEIVFSVLQLHKIVKNNTYEFYVFLGMRIEE